MTIRRTHLAMVALLAAVGLLLAAGGMALNTLAQGGTAGQTQGAMNPWLQYQGRLTRVPSGEPVNGNTYLTFRLFDTGTGGVPLWSEIKAVNVISGLFTTKLGDVMGLDPHLFNGQALWLEVAVEGDPSVTAPRQEILPVAYALALRPGALISDTSGEPALTVLNRGAGDALRVDGDLRVSGDLIGGAHAHSGSAITTGIVAEQRIDPAIARDSEVTAAVSNVQRVWYDVRGGSATVYTVTIPHFQLFRLEMASDWAYTYGLATLEGFENDGNTAVTFTKWDGRFGTAAYGGAFCSCSSQASVLVFGNAINSYGVRCGLCPLPNAPPYTLVITRSGSLPVNFKLIY